MIKLKKFSIVVLLVIFVLVGCSKGSGETASDPKNAPGTSSEPISLSVYQLSGDLTDAEFDEYFVQPAKKKFPNITLTLVRNTPGSKPQELVAAGKFPDIIFTDNNALYNQLYAIDNRFDLNDLVKRNHLDLTQFNSIAIEGIKNYSDNGELFALPFSINWNALFYNKDIFDKFGVPYPKDLMTWDELTDLAKKVTKNADGVQYRGLDPHYPYNVGSGLSLPVVDRKTNKAILNNDQWQKVFQTMKEIYQIPGNLPDINLYGKGSNSFLKDKNLAMQVYFGIANIGALENMYNKGDIMNWDMVSTPNFKEAAGKAYEINLHLLAISKSSKYKEQAFQVISLLLSDEVQTLATKNGRISSLNNPEIRKNFGTNYKSLKGKNIEGIFKATNAKLPAATQYDSLAKPQLQSKLKDVLSSGKDINTALREAEEEANKAIQSAIEEK